MTRRIDLPNAVLLGIGGAILAAGQAMPAAPGREALMLPLALLLPGLALVSWFGLHRALHSWMNIAAAVCLSAAWYAVALTAFDLTGRPITSGVVLVIAELAIVGGAWAARRRRSRLAFDVHTGHLAAGACVAATLAVIVLLPGLVPAPTDPGFTTLSFSGADLGLVTQTVAPNAPVQASVELANHHPRPVNFTVALKYAGQPQTEMRLTLGAGNSQSIRVRANMLARPCRLARLTVEVSSSADPHPINVSRWLSDPAGPLCTSS